MYDYLSTNENYLFAHVILARASRIFLTNSVPMIANLSKYCTVQYSTVQFRHNSLLSESNGYNYSTVPGTVLEQCEYCTVQSLLLALEYYRCSIILF
jgi:hypothetical protein